MKKAYRASLLRFDAAGQPVFDEDGLLVVAPDSTGRQRVLDAGSHAAVAPRHPDADAIHLPGRILAPGFVDMHIHFPQTDIIGSPSPGLLPWLENYTFPAESKFADPAHSNEVADVFFDELLRNGVTTSLTFATSHVASVDAFFEGAQRRGLRMITGKVLQDRHSPDGVRDETEQSLIDTEALIRVAQRRPAGLRHHAALCAQLHRRAAARRGRAGREVPDTWIQSHVAENKDEIAWVRELYPQSRSYLDVYDGFGLMRERAVYAHCIHLDDDRPRADARHRTAAAVSPTSNLFLGSGFFDFEGGRPRGLPLRPGQRRGRRHQLQPVPHHAGGVLRGPRRADQARPELAPQELWWQHTAARRVRWGSTAWSATCSRAARPTFWC
jgi:guanine deaminase